MPATQQTTPLQDVATIPHGALPSKLLPNTSAQPPTIGLIQSLQARNLREQLDAFMSPKSIKHGEQILFQPRVAEDVHIVNATGDMVPKVLITSLTLFLEIQPFKASNSGNFDANIHTYIPADDILPTLVQLKRSRPHLKAIVSLVESQLARTCIQVLSTTRASDTQSFRDYQRQYCRVRLAIASYTSFTYLDEGSCILCVRKVFPGGT